MTFLIRTDASLEIGTGHVMRCLTLAVELRALGVEPMFVSRAHKGNLHSLIASRGFQVHALEASDQASDSGDSSIYSRWLGSSWEADADAVVVLADSLKASGRPLSGLLVDHYALDERWEKRIRAMVPWIGVIDDLANRPHACNLLLDQNLYPTPESRYAGWVPPDCAQLIGPRYTLLRPEFRALRAEPKREAAERKRLLVFFGGSDQGNETAKALDAIDSLHSDVIETTVVIGQHHPFKEILKSRCEAMPRVQLLVQVDNMAELMANSDLAIGAGGTTTWERCCLGLPCLALCLAENQKELLETVHDAGALRSLGDSRKVTSEVLASALKEMLADSAKLAQMRQKAIALVDGLGAIRVAAEINRAVGTAAGPKWTLRRAKAEDIDHIFQWSNDPATRAASYQTAPIPYPDHERWFAGQLKDANSYFYILENDQKPCGQIRFKREGSSALIGFSVSPEARGQGLASLLLTEGAKRLLTDCPEIITLRGMVKKSNVPSVKAFQKAGFAIEKEETVSGVESWVFSRSETESP